LLEWNKDNQYPIAWITLTSVVSFILFIAISVSPDLTLVAKLVLFAILIAITGGLIILMLSDGDW